MKLSPLINFTNYLKLQIPSLNWCTFWQICLPFAKHCAPKKASHPVREKKPHSYVGEIVTFAAGALTSDQQLK